MKIVAIFVVSKGNDAADELERLNNGAFGVHRVALAEELDEGVPDTSNWKTYRNEKYEFEVKYPNEWSDSGGLRGNSQYLICFNSKGLSGDCVYAITINWNTNLDQWMSRWKESAKKNNEVFKESSLNVGGLLAKAMIFNNGREDIFVTRNNYVYHLISSELTEKMFDAILSTITFIR